jgi:hypothetical protein
MQIEEGKVYVTRDGLFHAGPMIALRDSDVCTPFMEWAKERYPFMCSQTRLPVRADGRWRSWPSTEDHELDFVAEITDPTGKE